MHQLAARNAIRAVLTEVFKELLDTTEGCEKIERAVRGIMKSIDEFGPALCGISKKRISLVGLQSARRLRREASTGT